MPTAAIAITNSIESEDRSVFLAAWPLLTANPDGTPLNRPSYIDMTWQAVGANWGTATLTLQGSNDNTNWFPLTKLGTTTAATFTADGGCATNENPLWVRPNLTTPGTAADVAVKLVAIRPTPLRT